MSTATAMSSSINLNASYYTGNASGRDDYNWQWTGNGNGLTYDSRHQWTGDNPNWTYPEQPNWTWPNIDTPGYGTYVNPIIPQTKIYVNCQYCGKNQEVKPNNRCSNCNGSLWNATVIPDPIQGRKAIIPLPPLPETPVIPELPPVVEPKKPKEKEFHAGDGTRWDDL